MLLLPLLSALAAAASPTVQVAQPTLVHPLTRSDVRRDDHGPIRRLSDLPDESTGEREPWSGPQDEPQALGSAIVSAHPIGSLSGEFGDTASVYEVTITLANGWSESFLFQEVATTVPRPLLVVYHKFNVSHLDALLHTEYFQEARKRGWFCMAPFGGNERHFSSIPSQIRTEAALDWVDANFAIERTRVYAVGFSMGGGAALNYAARHLDPTGLLFAAVANISGIVSLEDTYLNAEPIVQQRFDVLFGTGAPGSAEPWKMQRSSMFSFDPLTLQIDTSSDLARNLMHITTKTMRASGDIPYLITENDLLNQHFASLGAGPTQHTELVINTAGNYHSWDLVPESTVCDWLRVQRLVLPTEAKTLADSNRRYFYFDVQQDASNAFTPFTWAVDTVTNALSISNSANLRELTVHTFDAGLQPLLPLQVTLSTADLLPDEVHLVDWPAPPLDVQRDGVSVIEWSHDPQTSELTLFESDGGVHVWTVLP